MTDSDDQFRRLMASVLAGSDTAAAELLQRYGPVIRHAVRRRLNKRLRSKFDSVDFVQDVWASFFANPPAGEAFVAPQKLIAFLTKIARHKVVDATRDRLQTRKHNVSRERSLENLTPSTCADVAANQPTPSEVFAGRELWDRLLAGQPLVYRHILMLRRDGKNLSEIAAKMDLNPRTVRRILDKLLPKVQS